MDHVTTFLHARRSARRPTHTRRRSAHIRRRTASASHHCSKHRSGDLWFAGHATAFLHCITLSRHLIFSSLWLRYFTTMTSMSRTTHTKAFQLGITFRRVLTVRGLATASSFLHSIASWLGLNLSTVSIAHSLMLLTLVLQYIFRSVTAFQRFHFRVSHRFRFFRFFHRSTFFKFLTSIGFNKVFANRYRDSSFLREGWVMSNCSHKSMLLGASTRHLSFLGLLVP